MKKLGEGGRKLGITYCDFLQILSLLNFLPMFGRGSKRNKKGANLGILF